MSNSYTSTHLLHDLVGARRQVGARGAGLDERHPHARLRQRQRHRLAQPLHRKVGAAAKRHIRVTFEDAITNSLLMSLRAPLACRERSLPLVGMLLAAVGGKQL